MRFAFCLFQYQLFGGLEYDFRRIAELCVQRGHDVVVYTMTWKGGIPSGMKVITIPCSGWTNHARSKSFVKHVIPHLIKNNYAAIVGFNRMPFLDVYYAADLCYENAIRQRHGRWYRLTPRYRGYSALEKEVFSRDAKTEILLINKTEQAIFEKYYQTPSERFHLLPPGIKKISYSNAEMKNIRKRVRDEYQLTEQHRLILMVGTDFRRKGVDRAIYALASLPIALRDRTKLFVIGRGKENFLCRLAKRLNVANNILFLGGRHDVQDFMFAADLLLHPAYFETAGMVLLEALVSGLPILVTANCGYAFHIENAKAGMLVPTPFCQKTLNDCLMKMLTSSKRDEWRENAFHYAATEDIYSLTQRAVDIIERVAQRKK